VKLCCMQNQLVASHRYSSPPYPLLTVSAIQMNGAELPCGTVIQVEPANSKYKDAKASHYGPQSAQLSQKEETESPSTQNTQKHDKKEEAPEDLDDFFASLE